MKMNEQILISFLILGFGVSVCHNRKTEISENKEEVSDNLAKPVVIMPHIPVILCQ